MPQAACGHVSHLSEVDQRLLMRGLDHGVLAEQEAALCRQLPLRGVGTSGLIDAKATYDLPHCHGPLSYPPIHYPPSLSWPTHLPTYSLPSLTHLPSNAFNFPFLSLLPPSLSHPPGTTASGPSHTPRSSFSSPSSSSSVSHSHTAWSAGWVSQPFQIACRIAQRQVREGSTDIASW